MNRNLLRILVLVLAISAITVSSASAQDVRAWFDASTNMLHYEVTNGDAVEYTIHLIDTGCVSVAPGADTLLQGPDDAAQVEVICDDPGSKGQVEVQFCEGVICFEFKKLQFQCRDNCDLINNPAPVPASSTWGLAVLLGLLALTAVVVIRKRCLA